jgi:hypothetical protein
LGYEADQGGGEGMIMKSEEWAQITWSPLDQSFYAVNQNGQLSKLDMRTQEQREFDDAMAELEEWLKK